ncbi:aminodeoxychorismate/anthranilate synthase component II [Candidatus Peribacteria bacterium]|nr:aminodeoxychorismate/anthranilate synthase component II [Candidatus Peribacteria bacterium]
MRTLLIDNNDSFTENLAQLIRSLGAKCEVISSAKLTVQKVKKIRPDHIVLSAGPGHPKDARLSNEILHNFQLSTFNFPLRILGVCLGHQCIAHVFGGRSFVGHAPAIHHGKTSEIFHDGTSILKGLPSPFLAARYHSLIVKKLPKDFELLCWTGSQKTPELIMGMKHKTLPIVGVQFHPESFLTEHGERLMKNFLFKAL